MALAQGTALFKSRLREVALREKRASHEVLHASDGTVDFPMVAFYAIDANKNFGRQILGNPDHECCYLEHLQTQTSKLPKMESAEITRYGMCYMSKLPNPEYAIQTRTRYQLDINGSENGKQAGRKGRKRQ